LQEYLDILETEVEAAQEFVELALLYKMLDGIMFLEMPTYLLRNSEAYQSTN
jgi:hypothetical protein